MSRTGLLWRPGIAVCGLAVLTAGGCPTPSQPVTPPYNNTTDPTNGKAHYVGANVCASCHADIASKHAIHGHAFLLNPVEGVAPVYPSQAASAGVPNPPDGYTWNDVAYVLGGMRRKAKFIDREGFILVPRIAGVPTQWNLRFAPNGTAAGFAEPPSSASAPVPYAYECFRCHTTGPAPSDPAHPTFQDNRPGLQGTWQEPGVQCEACHGPGSNHLPDPSARSLYVNAAVCGDCHSRPFRAADGVIRAKAGYIRNHEQAAELRASGGHTAFACTVCHDPHTSVTADRTSALVKACRDCHADRNMALHNGAVFVRDDYVETVDCLSCHMPYATRSATAATTAVAGPLGRIGDIRTHIFRISTRAETYAAFFSDDGLSVRTDANGKAAVTVDFVCLRCHNAIGNAFDMTVKAAAAVTTAGGGMHAR